MTPPESALLQRELFRANTDACRELFDRHLDQRGCRRVNQPTLDFPRL